MTQPGTPARPRDSAWTPEIRRDGSDRVVWVHLDVWRAAVALGEHTDQSWALLAVVIAWHDQVQAHATIQAGNVPSPIVNLRLEDLVAMTAFTLHAARNVLDELADRRVLIERAAGGGRNVREFSIEPILEAAATRFNGDFANDVTVRRERSRG